MPESTPTKKPAARRKKATGPTKPAALKKLGITQEDLDLLAEVKEAREAVAKVRAESEAPAPSGTLTATGTVEQAEPDRPKIAADAIEVPQQTEQLSAKIKVYQTLKDADLPIPEDIRREVEAIVAQKTEQEEPKAGPWFARNLRNVEFRMRLDRQKSGTKSTTLKARGQRGDLVKLQAEDLEDDNLIANVQLGILEIIPIQEAKDVLSKQAQNQQQAVHPAQAMLRSETGKEVEFQGVVGDNTYTVARLDPQGGEAGNIPGPKRGVDWEAARNLGGNPHIVSDGFAPAGDPAATADAIARNRNIEGPAAGLGGLNFTGLAPVERA